jgi:hypothetical protein
MELLSALLSSGLPNENEGAASLDNSVASPLLALNSPRYLKSFHAFFTTSKISVVFSSHSCDALKSTREFLMQYFSFIFRSSMGLTEFHLLFCSLK